MNRQDFYDGKLFDAYRYMGAHKDGDKIRFVTYAPRASRISIIGEFNDWNEEFMEQDAQSGFFLFYSDKAKEGSDVQILHLRTRWQSAGTLRSLRI